MDKDKDTGKIDPELKDAATSQLMTTYVGEQGCRCANFQGKLGAQEKTYSMQACNVHVQACTIEQACEVCTDLYIDMHVKARTPLVGYTTHFMEFDSSTCVAVEVNNSQAVRAIQNLNKVDWVMMVAPGIAIVVSNPMSPTWAP